MRIVQTFWTAGRDPLTNNFGWLSPEYNLMSWALSCLSLRKHYNEVALYTDTEGKRVLIDLLHLPYTEVHVVYDETLCLPQHWAYAKVKTYSLQTKTFLHVDGDVYLPTPITEDVINAPLIAQNLEIGTTYYQQMMQRVFHNPDIVLPACVTQGLDDGSLSSYNMGVFGGYDLEFIHRYCEEVLNFLDLNHITVSGHKNSTIECNVFFEQILFAALADNEQKNVASVVSHAMYDQGYTISEFCNLRLYEKRPIHHLLGGHKYNTRVLRMLVQTLLRIYPETFQRILNLCPAYFEKIFRLLNEECSLKEGLQPYLTFLHEKRHEWAQMPSSLLIEIEQRVAHNTLYLESEYQDEFLLCVHPSLATFRLNTKLQRKTSEQIKERLHCSQFFPLSAIAVTPSASAPGFIELALLPIDIVILECLSDYPKKTSELTLRVIDVLYKGECLDYRIAYIKEETYRLIKNGIIVTKNIIHFKEN